VRFLSLATRLAARIGGKPGIVAALLRTEPNCTGWRAACNTAQALVRRGWIQWPVTTIASSPDILKGG